jgi:hypothetical protein
MSSTPSAPPPRTSASTWSWWTSCNLNLGSQAGAEASDQLKYFAERLPATFAYAGIVIENQGLSAGTQGQQIAGRFVVIPAVPFSYATTTDKDARRGLVGTLESMLRLHEHAPGTHTVMGDHLFHHTGGMSGSLSQLTRGAAVLAIEDGSERSPKNCWSAFRSTSPPSGPNSSLPRPR